MRIRISSIAALLTLALTLVCAALAIAGESRSTATEPAQTSQGDDVEVFLSKVLATTEDFWGAVFDADGLRYEEPKLVLFSGMKRG